MSRTYQTRDGRERPKRHPIRTTIIVLIIIAGLGISGYIVADGLARTYVTQFVQVGVAQELGASTDNVHVNIGKKTVLPQLVKRRIDSLDVVIDEFASGTIAGSATFDATAVPLNTKDPLGSIGITVRVDSANLLGLVVATADQKNVTVALDGSDILVSTTEKVHKTKHSATASYAPTANGTTLTLTPVSIKLDGKTYTPAQLKKSPLGSLVGGLSQTRTECLASGLPQRMTITGVSVKGQQLELSATGTGISLGGLSSKGTCTA